MPINASNLETQLLTIDACRSINLGYSNLVVILVNLIYQAMVFI